MPRRPYVLTERAEADLRKAREWSLARWGEVLTRRYFEDLHEGAEYIAANHHSLRRQQDLAGGSGLCLSVVREHYIVYEPLENAFIAIVAVVRLGRDIPAILRKWAAAIRREWIEIRAMIALARIRPPGRKAAKPKRGQ